MSLFGPHFDPNQLKVQLKLAVSRIQILRNKKANLVRDEKRHIAELLRNRSEDAARIRVETVIRDEALIECYSIIEVLCEMLFARLQLIACSHDMPPEIKEAIYTLIYAAQRVQIPELELIKKQLLAKYGKGLEHEVNCNCQVHVNPKIVHKLSYATPEPFLVFQYLNDIACQFKVDWSVEPILPPQQPAMIMPQQPMFVAAPTSASVLPIPMPQPGTAPPQMQQPMMFQQPPPQMQHQQQPPMMKSPPPFPTIVAPQHYTPPSQHQQQMQQPPHYTPTPQQQFPQPPPPAYTPSPTMPSVSSPPQFPSAPSQQPNNNFNNSKFSSPSPPPAYTPNANDSAFPDFDELTARFEALKRQNNN
ncbi:IST1-like protein [Heterostelium album PN500]|uniref:IST1-like protein n=1 Tax=Heterostelium pallidum (strain ATCC 26659 / Pp 5 / PN500) TaxID=670386 RepID=D3BU39_HETP5|nr:IST1-like protein [Heterostelium album PN500]EFA75225.1 IST1-like protein [Heterostelium album PN500]|eukprot:XP_020427359.1 IST1-like protein [Heterostelium album PN500]